MCVLPHLLRPRCTPHDGAYSVVGFGFGNAGCHIVLGLASRQPSLIQVVDVKILPSQDCLEDFETAHLKCLSRGTWMAWLSI